MWAIAPRGVGKVPGTRRIEAGWPLLADEAFTVESDPAGHILAADGKSLVPGEDMGALVKMLSDRVDADAEACRLQFITPGAGMAMTYAEKFAQAQAVDTMGEATANALSEPDAQAQFPTLSASVGLEAPTLWDAAQLVIERYAAFAQLSMSIERTRLAGKAAIKAATTVDGVRVAYGAIAWPTA